MPKLIDISGERFGRLVVMGRSKENKGAYASWRCLCDCGNIKNISGASIRKGKTVSCRCKRIESCRENGKKITHGLSKSTPLHSVWNGIKKISSLGRKHNAEMVRYRDRGIILCEEWDKSFLSFYAWAINSGYRKGLQIDRIDNDGNYEPLNCRFVPPSINAIN